MRPLRPLREIKNPFTDEIIIVENLTAFYIYLWKRLPLILMFANGYIIYRLFVVTKLTDVFVIRSLQKSRGKVNRICLYIIIASAALSCFIPNAVTVLILLPVLKAVETDIAREVPEHSLSTALTLSAIYGANIGGMGSLIGSPANLLLIGALDLYKVPAREQINFFNWFVWGLPLVAVFATVAWGLVATLAIPKEMQSKTLRLEIAEKSEPLSPEQKFGTMLWGYFLVFWIGESVLKELVPAFEALEAPVCICFFLLFIFLVFFSASGQQNAPLLQFSDLFTGLPKRGILFLILLAVIVVIVQIFRLDKITADFLLAIIPPEIPMVILHLLITLAVIFLTEMLSNTVVSTAFFPIAYFISTAHNLSPLPMMIAVSAASTCAFMTPIATPCNALAFGEMKGTSFRIMLISGFLLNLIGAVMMSAWLQFIIPLIYG